MRKVLDRAWNELGFETSANLSVAVVGTRKMASLQKQYRGMKEATDVLAFPQQSFNKEEPAFISPAGAPLELGDIVVCYPIALEQAAKLGVLVDERIEELALHGFSNLIGEEEK